MIRAVRDTLLFVTVAALLSALGACAAPCHDPRDPDPMAAMLPTCH